MGQLLGTSIKAIHSYEQGWRAIPPHVERHIFFLITRSGRRSNDIKSCWVVNKCPRERKQKCPAWEFRAGKLCWFINGTICEGLAKKNWKEKMEICRECKVLAPYLYE